MGTLRALAFLGRLNFRMQMEGSWMSREMEIVLRLGGVDGIVARGRI